MDNCNIIDLENLSFQILTRKKSFVVVSPTASSKLQWMEKMAKYVKCDAEIMPTNKRASKKLQNWVAHSQISKLCSLCHTDFSFFNKRFICHNCGIFVCKSCSSSSVSFIKTTVSEGEEASTICGECVQQLKKDQEFSCTGYLKVNRPIFFFNLILRYFIHRFCQLIYLDTAKIITLTLLLKF